MDSYSNHTYDKLAEATKDLNKEQLESLIAVARTIKAARPEATRTDAKSN